ncbi:BTAD domain-containing putative transcriptional regulator [Longispora urticae]
MGQLEASSSGEVIPLGGARQVRLLAALLLSEDAVVPLDRIGEVLWDNPPQSARQQIHNAIAGLRRALAVLRDTDLITSQAGYRLVVADQTVDVRMFHAAMRESEREESGGDLAAARERLQAALGLWRGPALSGITAGNRYLQGVAARLDEERMVAVERLMSLRLRLDPSSSLVGDLVGLVAANPLRESLRGTLMLALQYSGRQSDALSVYEEGRRLLADEIGLDPGPDLRRIQRSILRGELPVGPPPSVGIVHGASASMSFLPRDTIEFTGRSADIHALLSAVDDPSSTALVISAIEGMGGVGKTALAVRVAHQISEQYPDGHYFVDLHGFTVGTKPATPNQALEVLLRQAGVPVELIPADMSARTDLWRSRLAGKRALVLLDNVTDEAQVRPLLPSSPGTRVFVTSRRRLTALEGAVPLALDILPRGEAAELFVQISGRERSSLRVETLNEIVDLCGRLPLAVRIAAARFRDRASWTVEDLLGQLRTHRRRTRFLTSGDRSVMAVLRLSYEYLTAVERSLFRLLSLHPVADFDSRIAAALANMSVEDAELCLESLFEYSLLLQHSAGRYEFHDLVRDCSQELLYLHDDEPTRHSATHRMLDYYLATTHAWCRSWAIGVFRFDIELENAPNSFELPCSDEERAELLKQNYQGLVAASRFAAENGWLSHTWQLPCALMPYLPSLNYGGDAADLFEMALAAARATGVRVGEVASLAALAVIARDRESDTVTARRHLETAIRLSEEAGEITWQAYLTTDLGIACLKGGDVEDARQAFSGALSMARSADDQRLAANLTNNLGVICLHTGQYQEALALFEWVAGLGDVLVSQYTQVLTQVNIGLVHHLDRRFVAALETLSAAADRSQQAGMKSAEAWALSRRSAVYRSLGAFGPALSDGRKALEIARSLGQAEAECEALNALGELFVSQRELQPASTVFLQVHALAKEHGLSHQAARAAEGLAHLAIVSGDADGALRFWKEAVDSYPEGYAAVSYAGDHLDAVGDPDVVCPRCEVLPDARHVRIADPVT